MTRCDDPKKCGSRQPSAFGRCPAKSLTSLRRCVPKKYSSRKPSAFGRSPAKSLTSLRNCALKRRSGQAAFGFGSIPCEKSHQPSEMYLEKIFRSDCLRLLVDTLQKASPAFGNVPRKNVETRWPSTFGQSFSENLSSDPLRRLEKVQLQTAFGFWSIPCKKPLQPSEMYPEKMFRSDNFRLLLPTDREAPQVTRCDDPKKCGSRLPLALDLY